MTATALAQVPDQNRQCSTFGLIRISDLQANSSSTATVRARSPATGSPFAGSDRRPASRTPSRKARRGWVRDGIAWRPGLTPPPSTWFASHRRMPTAPSHGSLSRGRPTPYVAGRGTSAGSGKPSKSTSHLRRRSRNRARVGQEGVLSAWAQQVGPTGRHRWIHLSWTLHRASRRERHLLRAMHKARSSGAVPGLAVAGDKASAPTPGERSSLGPKAPATRTSQESWG
jgi:hypothetical protein